VVERAELLGREHANGGFSGGKFGGEVEILFRLLELGFQGNDK
jgi:hypothetical protein